MSWFNNNKGDGVKDDPFGTIPHAVPVTFPILYSEQSAGHADNWTYHYPPAQAEHGRWYNNVAYGNAIPNSMLGASKAIPGVTQLPWMIQYNREIIPFQLRNTAYPYGGTTSGISTTPSLLTKASQLVSTLLNKGGQNGGG